MNKEQLDENIYVIHEFFNQQEIDEIEQFIKDNELNWQTSSNTTTNPAFDNNLLRITHDLYSKIIKKISELDIPGSCLNLHDFVHRFQTTQSMPFHTDEPHNGIMTGIVIYINDDYKGGEISYPSEEYLFINGIMSPNENTKYSPKQNIDYSPSKGDLVYHDSKVGHQVNKVTEGTRYSFTAFKNNCSDTNCDGTSCFNKSNY